MYLYVWGLRLRDLYIYWSYNSAFVGSRFRAGFPIRVTGLEPSPALRMGGTDMTMVVDAISCMGQF